MNFRGRIFLTSVLLVWVPLFILAWVIRQEMSERLTEEHLLRVNALARSLENDLDALNARLHDRLQDLHGEILDDNEFRLAAVEGISTDPAFLPNYAGRVMKLAGLSVLQIMDPSGVVLSSGHFRNEYGARDTTVHRLLAGEERPTLARFRGAEETFLVMAHAESLLIADRAFMLVGGVAVGREFLSQLAWEEGFSASLISPGFAASSDDSLNQSLRTGLSVKGWTWDEAFPRSRYLVHALDVPFVVESGKGNGRMISASFVSAYSLDRLQRTLLHLDGWLLAVIIAALMGTWMASAWVAVAISRPLMRLAQRASQIDLERTIEDFPATRKDEVGDLARFLNSMNHRLRSSTHHLRVMEREATRGELARQVNHDVRNGLTPIRNAISHLDQVANRDPQQLVAVWNERAEGLRSGLHYLEELGANYAKLYRHHPRKPCDVNELVREQASAVAGEPDLELEMKLAETLPSVYMDPTAFRRILENLITNARESFEGGDGRILVETWNNSDEGVVGVAVSDNGPGISPEDQHKIFSGFYSTKEDGSGLGLLIVRRMVADANGSIRVESQLGSGTRFELLFPPSPNPVPKDRTAK